ncbi:MAG: CDP-diacylglycerol--serine O-phosphatidyltransferase [Dehalococcoidia bacterium]|nr:CDP-diacylglycerol--serine O-phosphatidyltransferase [Myxococcales bacterium]MCA9857858.1 CDP-diacylglycerol--serine O-phosphatidyltransferase [Dehalococcoidia bacterium]
MRVRLRKTLFILPNLFTLASVLCGYYAILLCADAPTGDDYYRAALLILYAMFFDTIDGRVARLTRTQSAIGVQLDSLADVISFGVAPAVLVFRWSLQDLGTLGMLAGFAYVAAGAVRLARFNVLATTRSGAPKKPGKYILGLPIPAAAGILVSLVAADKFVSGPGLPGSPLIVLGVVIALAFFMVSAIRFRSFKDIRLNTRTVLLIAIAIGSTAFIALRYQPSYALVCLLVSYIAIGVVENLVSLLRSGHRPRDPATEEPPDKRDGERSESKHTA